LTLSMSKHSRSNSVTSPNPRSHKLSRSSTFSPIKVASKEAAAAVDKHPPLSTLLQAVEQGVKDPAQGDCVVYWMRMSDLRSVFPWPLIIAIYSLATIVSDNRALFMASEQAKQEAIPLMVLFAISPQDYVAHDRSARRIDFTLRNLAIIKASIHNLSGLNYKLIFNHRRPWRIFIFLSTSLRTLPDEPYHHKSCLLYLVGDLQTCMAISSTRLTNSTVI